MGIRLTALGMNLLLLASFTTSPATAKNCKVHFAKVNPRHNAYPEKIALESLNRTIPLNAWVDLNKLSDKEIRAFFQELLDNEYLVELSSGQQSRVKHFYVGKKNKRTYLQLGLEDFTNPKSKYHNTVTLTDFETYKQSKIRISATPSKIEHPIFIIRKSLDEDLERTKLSENDIALLKEKAMGVMTFADFLKDRRFKKSKKDVMLLGNDGFVYRRLAEERQYEVFDTVYSRYYEDGTLQESAGPWDTDTGPIKKVTDRFMTEISGYQIVFLLPENFPSQKSLYGKGKPGYTYDEWLWLKKHPETLKNAIFVTGDTTTIGPKGLWNISGSNEHEKQKHLTKIFVDPTPYELK